MVRDLHREKAAEIFGVPSEKVTQKQRKYAKLVNYTLAYSKPGPLGAVVQLSPRQAAVVHRQFTKKGKL